MKLLLSTFLFLSLTAFSQVRPTASPITANRIIRSTGVPPAGQCALSTDVGKVYIRSDAATTNASFYSCDNTASMTYAWELSGGGSGVGFVVASPTVVNNLIVATNTLGTAGGDSGIAGDPTTGSLVVRDKGGQVYNVLAYGLVSGTSNQTAALQALVNAVPNYSTIYFPPGVQIYTTGLAMLNRKGLLFQGSGSTGPSSSPSGSPKPAAIIFHSSGTPGNPLISCDGCLDMTLQDMVLDGAGVAGDGWKAFHDGSATQITQNLKVLSSAIMGNSAGSAQTNFIGIDWCGTADTSNCELLTVTNASSVNCQGGGGGTTIGIRVGHSNAVQNKIEGSSIASCHQGISYAGSVLISRNLFNANDVDIAGSGPEPQEISFNRTENGTQFYNGNTPVFMHDNRFGAKMGSNPWINIGSSNADAVLTFVNNEFSNDGSTVFNGTTTALFSEGNLYPDSEISGGVIVSASTFNRGYTSLNDSSFTLNITNHISPGTTGLATDATGPASGLVGISGVVSQSIAGSTGGSGVVGYLNGSGSGVAVRGTTTGLGTSGTLASAAMLEADLGTTVSATTLYSFYAPGPTSVSSAATNVYGVYIGPHKITNVTNGWGVYQVGAQDINYIAGHTGVGNLNNALGTLTASILDRTATTGTTAVYIGSDNNGHTSATSTSLVIEQGVSQGSVNPIQVLSSSGALTQGGDGNSWLGQAYNTFSASNIGTNTQRTGAFFNSTMILASIGRYTFSSNNGSGSDGGNPATADTSLSRDSAGVIDFGTGAQGSKTGAFQVTAGGTVAVLTANLKACSAGGSTPTGLTSYEQAVSDSVAPALGVALTGGGTVWAHVHCSLTTGTYIVDGI